MPQRLTLLEGHIKSFPDNEKLKQFINTKPVLQEISEGLLEEEGREEGGEREERGREWRERGRGEKGGGKIWMIKCQQLHV